MIADGTYDVFIVDAAPFADEDDAAGPTTGWHLELTILAGEHKGDVVPISAASLTGSEFELIGMPGTLRVLDGRPTFTVDT